MCPSTSEHKHPTSLGFSGKYDEELEQVLIALGFGSPLWVHL